MTPDRDAGPLGGVRVLELGSLLAGPMAVRILGDFGADVIKIEAPGRGDQLRTWGLKQIDGRDNLWTIYARNKRCITLNMRDAEGQRLFKLLVEKADILIENFRPGTLEKWGLGPNVLHETNPALIMVRTSGYGQTGPYHERAGFGSIAEAMGGIRYTTGFPDRAPTRTGVSLGDSLAALFGVIGALIALVSRDREDSPTKGKGQIVDVAIYEAVYALMESLIPDFVLLGQTRERTGSVLPHVAPSNVYPCQDGVDVLIAGNADNVFARLAPAIGQPELADDPKFATHSARGDNQEEIDAIVAAWTQQHRSADVLDVMEQAGVPAGLVYTAKEITEDPHYKARQMIEPIPIENGRVFPMPGIVPKLSETPGKTRWPGPLRPGSHNDEIYANLLGLSKTEISELTEQGII